MTKNIGARLRKAGVADTQFLRLGEKWALAFDNAQWIVQRAERDRGAEGGVRWRAVAFIASDKGTLERVLQEKGAVIGGAGLAALGRLPETFREWVSLPPARRFKAGHSVISGVAGGDQRRRSTSARGTSALAVEAVS